MVDRNYGILSAAKSKNFDVDATNVYLKNIVLIETVTNRTRFLDTLQNSTIYLTKTVFLEA